MRNTRRIPWYKGCWTTHVSSEPLYPCPRTTMKLSFFPVTSDLLMIMIPLFFRSQGWRNPVGYKKASSISLPHRMKLGWHMICSVNHRNGMRFFMGQGRCWMCKSFSVFVLARDWFYQGCKTELSDWSNNRKRGISKKCGCIVSKSSYFVKLAAIYTWPLRWNISRYFGHHKWIAEEIIANICRFESATNPSCF